MALLEQVETQMSQALGELALEALQSDVRSEACAKCHDRANFQYVAFQCLVQRLPNCVHLATADFLSQNLT